MNYYTLAFFDNSPILTYCSRQKLEEGEVVLCDVRGRQREGVILQSVQKPSFECKEVQRSGKAFLPHQNHLARFISEYYCASIGQSYGIFHPFIEGEIEGGRREFVAKNALSPIQKEAFDSLKQRSFSLLFGETGSGKSEVYIHLLIEVLKEGKQALFLMPEIALTPQMQKRLEVVFGEAMGVWHSKMSAKKKREVLEGLCRGKISLIIGTRSALFLPYKNLGAIVVDEEHDDSYKSQSNPKYNAKDLTIYLGKKFDLQVLLGSATPSVNSYYLAKREKAIFSLPKHFDSSNEVIFLKQKTELSESIFEAIAKSLENQKQVMIFLPTRANFKTLLCGSCGGSVQCPYCSVGMSLHLKESKMSCHYCGYSQSIPLMCPSCQSEELISQRIGTAQVAQELRVRFPQAGVELFDRDHITTQKKLETTLKEFAKGEIDILVGTQMLSKGHDYHNVNLVVILGLDYVLSGGDYRARERAQSLFFQIKGRGGRRERGVVLMQTLNPCFFSYKHYEEFLEEELKYRKDLYPPFFKLALLIFSHRNESEAKRAMSRAMVELNSFGLELEVVGGGSALIAKIKTQYRYMIMLRAKKISPILKAYHLLRAKEDFEIDIDPLNIV